MSRTRAAVLAAASGAAVAIALWAADLASLRRLTFAGVADPESQGRLMALAAEAAAGLETRLAALHLVAGASCGLLAAWGVGSRRAGRLGLAAAGTSLLVHGLALLGMMATYPQLYADRWWLAGGARAAVQRAATHLLGPRVFDALLILLVFGLLAAGAWRRRSRARALARAAPAAAAALALALLAFAGAHPRRPPPAGPNLLILAADSLRTDRIESAQVMPGAARRVPRGTLFRYAFTPVARTFPSWVSTLTGTEPRRNGVRTMFPTAEARRDVGPTFLTELRDAGWRTFVVSDFAGDVFPRFAGGFEEVDAPSLTVDSLAAATLLSAHGFSLPALRLGFLRDRLSEWRNLASLSDPDWLVARARARIARGDGRPFAGVVFFSTPHFPYVAPHPDYLRGADGYAGTYLYHAPPLPGVDPSPEDVGQVRARYDGALHAVDRAAEGLLGWMDREGLLGRTVVVVTGDHGEELYEEAGIAGHGDVLGAGHSQHVPVLLFGPGVPAGRVSSAQVRLYDLAPTVLELLRPGLPRPVRFGDGMSLFAGDGFRPVCVETGLWFWPDLPRGLRGERLRYPGIAELLELDEASREMVLRPAREARVESAKRRGIVLGNRLHWEGFSLRGHVSREVALPGVLPAHGDVALRPLFDERCVAGDPRLARFYDGVVWRDEGPGRAAAQRR